MNEHRENSQAIQFSEKSKSSKWWIYVKPCICPFNSRIEVKCNIFHTSFGVSDTLVQKYAKNYHGTKKFKKKWLQ